MFKKIIIAEDHEIANISVQKTLIEIGIPETKYVYYCDHALAWIQKALQEGNPYDLLITDLIFEEDGSVEQLNSGFELIRAAKALQADLKIIVLSSEGRSEIVDDLFEKKLVEGYVRKARRDAQHLREALDVVYKHKIYQSPEAKSSNQERNAHEFTTLDLTIIGLLAQGIPQKNIPVYLKERNIKPSGLRTVEGRLHRMREMLEFSNNEQLVVYCKDFGLI